MRRQVLVREVCPECRGDGYIVHPAWKEYWRAHRTLDERALDERALREWFSQEGYGEIPPEEEECRVCGGRGHVERWVDIREVCHA